MLSRDAHADVFDALRQADLDWLDRILLCDPTAARAVDSAGRSALWHAALEGYHGRSRRSGAFVRRLLEAGAEVDLHAATWLDDVPTVQDVLQLDPSSVNRHDGDGRSALHHAAERDGVAVAAVLLDHGAAWDSPDRMGLTPLMVCAEPSPWRDDLAVRVAALLMAHGARPTAGEVAALDLDLPFEAAQVDAPDAWGRRPLLRAVEHGRRRQVRRLLDAGADASAPTAAGRTPLMVAVARARDGTDPGIVADLVSAGADPDARDRAGDTPRRLAQRHRLDAVLRLLG